MSISYKELMGSHTIAEIPLTHQHNLEILLKRINIIREAWGKPMTVTSGYRSEQDQLRINSKAPNSKHRLGMACDIYDPDNKLEQWLKTDPTGITTLERAELWCEEGTSNWVHFQTAPPRSNRRWFLP